jgi:GGDEF domain-containing protein
VRKTIHVIVLILGGLGLSLALLLFTQGARITGALVCALGFIGLIYVGYNGLTETYVERADALNKLSNLWETKLQDARSKNLPLSILSIWVDRFPSPEEINLLLHSIRTQDAVYPVKDGYYLLLGDTDSDKTQRAVAYIQNLLAKLGYSQAVIGVACFPVEGEQMRILLERANVALNIARFSNESKTLFFRETLLPEGVNSLFAPMSYETMEYLIRLKNVWSEAKAKNQPLSAIGIHCPDSKDKQLSLIKVLNGWLRGIDQVGMLIPDSVIIVLANTNQEGCALLSRRLEKQLSAIIEGGKPVFAKIHPVVVPLKDYLEDYKDFIQQLLTMPRG